MAYFHVFLRCGYMHGIAWNQAIYSKVEGLGAYSEEMHHSIMVSMFDGRAALPIHITITYLFKYTENFTTKNWIFSDKKYLIFFSYFCSKQRLWVLVRTPRWGGSNEYPQSMFLSRNKKINVYPLNPSFTILKWGLRGSKLYRYVFVMTPKDVP